MLYSIQYVTLICWTDYIGGLNFLTQHWTGLNLISQNVPNLSTWVLIDLRLCHYDWVSLRGQCRVLLGLVSILFLCWRWHPDLFQPVFLFFFIKWFKLKSSTWVGYSLHFANWLHHLYLLVISIILVLYLFIFVNSKPCEGGLFLALLQSYGTWLRTSPFFDCFKKLLKTSLHLFSSF